MKVTAPLSGGRTRQQRIGPRWLARGGTHSEGVIAKATPAATANRVLSTSWSSSHAVRLARDATAKITARSRLHRVPPSAPAPTLFGLTSLPPPALGERSHCASRVGS